MVALDVWERDCRKFDIKVKKLHLEVVLRMLLASRFD